MGFCIRRRDEYGNRHDEVATSLHMLPVVAEIVERGYSDEYRDIIVLEGGEGEDNKHCEGWCGDVLP